MKEKLKWLWDNIESIYIDKGIDYTTELTVYVPRCKVNNLLIISNDGYFDNYFECVVENDYNFKISIEYSFTNESRIYFEPYNISNDIDFYIDKLKPIFREYKINYIL